MTCYILSDLPDVLSLGYLSTMIGKEITWVCDILNDIAKYKKIWPVMIKVCSVEGYNSTKGKAALDWLASTIPYGARRRLFQTTYVETGRWHNIPADPADLPKGIRAHFSTK